MEMAKDLYYQIYQKNTTDPCLDSNMFTCKLINDGVNTGIYTITQLGLKKNNDTLSIITNANFSVFKNATYILIGDGIILDSSLFNTLPNFYNKASIYIYNESIPIPNDIILPINLNQVTFTFINVPIPSNIFSGSIEVFNILGVGYGFSLPSLLPENVALKRFSTFLGYYSPFPSNAGSALKSLTSLRLSFNNDITEIGYKNYSFPTFQPFSKLQTLYISFINFGNDSNSQLWNFEQSITNLTTLNDFHITGKGFILNSSFKYTDFSNLPETFFIYFSNGCDLISNCISKPCLKLPKKSGISVIGCDFNIKNIDFTNITYMKMQNNDFEQELPTNEGSGDSSSSNINYSTTRLDFQDNVLVGSIPEEYCQFYKSKYPTLSYNELTGEIPTCFSCMGSNYTITKNLLPNQFTDFNEKSLPTNCETFNFSLDYNKIVKTDGSTIITINGKDFGWDFSLPSGNSNNDNVTLLITIPNNEITLSIPKGEGSNKTFIANFGYQFKFSQTFTYSYELPVITSYSFGNDSKFYLNGNGFSFINNNSITLNGVSYKLTIATTADDQQASGNGYSSSISFIDDGGGGEINNPIDSMLIGDEFNVSITVGNQVSNIVTFYLYKSISISISSLSNTKLNISGSSGGSGSSLVTVTFDGEFGTTNSKIVFVNINGIQCSVKSVTPQSLTISSYPSVPSVGKYQISINVGGLIFNDQIEYIKTPTTTNTTSSEENGDDGSFGSLSSQPISLLSLIILSIISLITLPK
ncbi:hypothetical protein ACTFIR_003221 [Dictyostelium discoideum]